MAEKLSQSPGVGVVLARSSSGPVCFCRGKRYRFPESGAWPFSARADAALVINAITELMSMPSAGDLVICGNDATEGNVSFIPEHGAHAGPSAEEMNTFLLGPSEMSLPETITHPSQLYTHFMQYQLGLARCPTSSSEQPNLSAIRKYRAANQ